MFDSISKFLDPTQRELDLMLLVAIVFVPGIAAIFLFAVPAAWKNLMRWLAVFAMALQLGLGLCAVVDYYNRILDLRSDRSVRSLYHPSANLDIRVEKQISDMANQRAFLSHDLVARRAWIEPFNIYFALGADGINLALILLSSFVTLTAIVASWKVEENTRGFLVLILLLQTGVSGAFLALDFFLFYVFYELMLIPMYFLIGLWGGTRRKYASMKFVIYTLLGSVGILAAMIALASADCRDFVDQEIVRQRAIELKNSNPKLSEEQAIQQASVRSFDISTLSKMGRAVMLILNGREDQISVQKKLGEAVLPGDLSSVGHALFAPGVDREKAIGRIKAQPICSKAFQYTIFVLVFVGFAVKLPIVPLHSWLPDAHVEAPTPISMILAGILLKVGGYGLIRIAWPVCPFAACELAWWLSLLAVICILYGAIVALGQTDFKKLLAYSSVSHMGFVLLGISIWPADASAEFRNQAVGGALFQMIAHGISAAGLFYCVGVVYDRAHHRDLNRLGGLTEPMPFFSGISAILFFASMALPCLCGFIGEFFVLVGSWSFSMGLTIAAVLSTILTAGYLLWAMQRAYLGVNQQHAGFLDLQPNEWAVLLPYVLFAIALGVYPAMLFVWTDPATTGWVSNLTGLK